MQFEKSQYARRDLAAILALLDLGVASPRIAGAAIAITVMGLFNIILSDCALAAPPRALANARQYELEATAETILKTPEMKKTMEEARQLLLASKYAHSEAARNTLDQVISECGGYAALTAATKDAQNPGLVWIQTPLKEWMGHTVSGSRFAFDKLDNIYRYALIDDKATYTLDLRPTGPTGRLSVAIYQALTGAEVDDWEKQTVDTADSERIKVDSDGVARITIRPWDRKDGRLHLNSAGGGILFVREALGDWRTQRPRSITFRKIAGPESEPVSFEDRVAIAQRYMILEARTIADWDNIVNPLPTNAFALTVKRGHDTKPSMIRIGWFHLADDEVLIANLLPLSAEYSSFSVTSPWQVTRNYIDKSGSRTSFQSHQNADGTYTYVVSRRDPGVANWMDTSGLSDGGMVMRWEGVDAPGSDLDASVKSVKVVKLGAMPSELPFDFPSVSPAERAAEFARRKADYETRCGVPCRFIEE